MRDTKRWLWFVLGWMVLLAGGFLNMSCLAPYYYDPHGVRVWRDGHDDDWHRSHGDHWDEDRDHHDHDHDQDHQ